MIWTKAEQIPHLWSAAVETRPVASDRDPATFSTELYTASPSESHHEGLLKITSQEQWGEDRTHSLLGAIGRNLQFFFRRIP
jgi:hypothetical protein